MGKGRAGIFESFENLEKCMVWNESQSLNRAHQSGMWKGREDRIPAKCTGHARLRDWPATLRDFSSVRGKLDYASLILCWRCPATEQPHQNSLRWWLFMQHNRKSQSGGFLNDYFRVDGQQDNSDSNGNDFYLKLSTLATHIGRMNVAKFQFTFVLFRHTSYGALF